MPIQHKCGIQGSGERSLLDLVKIWILRAQGQSKEAAASRGRKLRRRMPLWRLAVHHGTFGLSSHTQLPRGPAMERNARLQAMMKIRAFATVLRLGEAPTNTHRRRSPAAMHCIRLWRKFLPLLPAQSASTSQRREVGGSWPLAGRLSSSWVQRHLRVFHIPYLCLGRGILGKSAAAWHCAYIEAS